MTVLDWVLVVVWAGITMGGFFKGAIRIVFGLGGLALGIWLAVVVAPDLALALTGRFNSEWLILGLAYLIPFAIVSVLCLLAGWGMEKTLEGLKLGCVNRGLGALLAGSVAAAVLAALLVTAVRLSPEVASMQERSVLLERVRTVLGWVAEIREGDQARPLVITPEDQDADAPAGTDEDSATGETESNGR
jgi:uncharacterized membrane protein required for colicin V production